MYIVYEIWNPFTLECIYVGKGNTKESKWKRFRAHLKEVERLRKGQSVENGMKAGVKEILPNVSN